MNSSEVSGRLVDERGPSKVHSLFCGAVVEEEHALVGKRKTGWEKRVRRRQKEKGTRGQEEKTDKKKN